MSSRGLRDLSLGFVQVDINLTPNTFMKPHSSLVVKSVCTDVVFPFTDCKMLTPLYLVISAIAIHAG